MGLRSYRMVRLGWGKGEGGVGLGWMGMSGLWRPFHITLRGLGLTFQDGNREPL